MFLYTTLHQKYHGVALDRSLTYKKHTENVRDKVKSRCNIISKLTGTDWGAPATVLRTSAIALVYSVAEYCVPVWGRCAHVQHVDALNIAMRTFSGALRPTNINRLPVLCNIEPRRFAVTVPPRRSITYYDLFISTPLIFKLRIA